MNLARLTYKLVAARPNPDNKRFDIATAEPLPLPVYVFWHIYCGPNEWRSIFDEQNARLRQSGLMDAASRIYVTILSPHLATDRQTILDSLPADKVHVVHASTDGSCFEFPCLQTMRRLADEEDFLAMYFHTKGSSYDKQSHLRYGASSFDSLNRCTIAWRNMMEYFCVDKWRMAVNVLAKGGFGTYGCYYRTPQTYFGFPYHYCGNFWWATSRHVRTLPAFSDVDKENRFKAEFWVASTPDISYDAFTSWCNLYLENMPEWAYRDSNWMKRAVFTAYHCYMFFRYEVEERH